MDRFEEIRLDKIEWPDPVREEIRRKDVEDMAKSILASGQIHPIVVELTETGKFNGIVGRLRYEGVRRLGWTSILCRVHSFLDDSGRKAWQLIENLVRRELTTIAIGEGYKSFKQYCEAELGGKYDKDIIGTMRTKIQDVSGDKAPSEKTIWKYIQFAEEIPENVKIIVKTLPRETFGKRHAEQLLRLKDDPEAMLKFAEWLRDTKPTSSQLKAQINDHLKVQSQAVDVVKEAFENEEITLRQAAAISEAEDVQGSVLAIAKKGNLKPTEVKKIVDFAGAHEDHKAEILQKGIESPELAVAIAEGKAVLETPEEVRAFFRGKKGLTEEEKYEIPCVCPCCKDVFRRKIKVNWSKGEVTFE